MPLSADESFDLHPRDEWFLSVSPYVWAAGLNGAVGAAPGLPPVEVDAGFRDILENLDLAAMTVVDLRYQRFGVYADIVFTKITVDAEAPAQIIVDDAELENALFIGTFGGSYRALQHQSAFLDLLAGARIWSVDTRLSLDGGILEDRQFEGNQNWVDPVVGLKGRLELGAGVYLNGLAHVGGFGAASDLTWDVFGGVGYRFNDTVSMIAGYRHLEVDYDKGGFAFDVEMTGPVIGATIRF